MDSQRKSWPKRTEWIEGNKHLNARTNAQTPYHHVTFLNLYVDAACVRKVHLATMLRCRVTVSVIVCVQSLTYFCLRDTTATSRSQLLSMWSIQCPVLDSSRPINEVEVTTCQRTSIATHTVLSSCFLHIRLLYRCLIRNVLLRSIERRSVHESPGVRWTYTYLTEICVMQATVF